MANFFHRRRRLGTSESLASAFTLARWCGGLLILATAGACLATSGRTIAGAAPAPVRSASRPDPSNPALAKFDNAITLYVSFDHLPLIADMSGGDGRPANISGLTVLEPGLYGRALLLGPLLRWPGISYKAAHNIDLSKPGALAVWISAYHWRRNQNKTPYLFFVEVNDRGRVLGLARMGVFQNHEAVYAYAGVGGKVVSIIAGNSLRWRTGQWHLLVVNWRSEALALSLDGRLPGQTSLAPTGFPQAHGPPGCLVLHGGLSPLEPCLLDELLVFNHPLSGREIQWLWRQGCLQARRGRRQ